MIQKKRVKAFTVIVLSIVLLTSGATALVPLQQSVTDGINPFEHENARRTWEVDDDRLQCPWADFTSIQRAIDAAADGDTILVYLGEYDENLIVNKEVALAGISSPFPVIDGCGNGDVIVVNHSDVSIETFEITGSTNRGTGVNITSYNSTYIYGCNIIGNVNGIWTNRSKGDTFVHNWIHDNAYYGILCQRTNESFILMNIIEFNSYSGVSLSRSCANSISEANYIDNNDHHGVSLANASNNNEICDNSIIDNLLNGVLINRSQNITIANNQIDNNGRNGVYLNHSQYVVIETNPTISNNNYNGIYLFYTNWTTIQDNPWINNNGLANGGLEEKSGIILNWSDHNTIKNNTCDNNSGFGIGLRHDSDNNTLEKNVCSYSGDDGISVRYGSDDNKIRNGNNIHHSTDEGIHLKDQPGEESSNNILIENNIIHYNNLAGIIVDTNVGTGIVIRNNTVFNTSGGDEFLCGILICTRHKVEVINNTVFHNQGEGIYIHSDSGNNENYHIIERNTVYGNGFEGICIKTRPSNHNTIKNNTVFDNKLDGIWINASNNNTITDCHVYNNTQNGIHVKGSTCTNITNCTIDKHPDNFGITIEGSSHIIIRDCTVRNNTGSTANGINLDHSSDNQIIHCTVLNMGYKGISVQLQSLRNNITDCTLLNNSIGIRLFSDCSLNTIRHCVIHGNSGAGINIESTCNNNLIFDNHFNNTCNAKDDATNQWNITKTPGINIIGGSFLGGNYWHNYTGIDTDGDGLGDTVLPYNCSGNIKIGGDSHPLLPQSTNNPPNAPSNPNPSYGATNVSTTTDLNWTGGDPDPGDTVTYDVYFGTTASPPKITGNQTGTTFGPGVLQYSTTYYWRIVAWDNHNASTEGAFWMFTTKENSPPVFGAPSPVNGSTGNPVSLTWSIPINDPEGNTFTWTIQCSNGQSSSGAGSTNGTKTLALSGLTYARTYTVWVNATDSGGSGQYTRRWYTFTTKTSLPPVFGSPTPANGSTNQPLGFTWSILINDPEGDQFSWTIQCSNGQQNSGTGASNGTKSVSLSGLGYSKIYKVWVNATDPSGSGQYTRRWYTFTTQQQPNRPPDKPSKPSGSTKGKIKTLYTYTTSTKDPNGDQVYYQWSWGDGTTSNWIGPFDSGALASAQHTWTKKGSYQIKVKAEDTYGLESNWSDPLLITMPLNNPFSFPSPLLQFLERLFERFPHMFPILRQLLG